MKPFGWLGTAVLFSILGMTATVAAQQDDRDKPPQAPAHEDQAAPPQEKRAEDAKPAQQDEKQTHQDDKRVQDQEKKDNKRVQDQEKREPKNDKRVQDQEKQQPKDENRAQQQDKNHPQMKRDQDAHRAAGNGGGRIPDDKFRSHFGREHHFRVSRPTVVSGQPRFEYSGFTFIMVDPWPAGWDYADDCYLDYVDGEYLLYDLAHPGVSIVVNVVL